MKADCMIMAHQFVVSQLSRNPIRAAKQGPFKQLQDAPTMSYNVDLFDHDQPEDILCRQEWG